MAVSDYDELLRKLLPPGMALDACNQPEAAELVNKTAVELHPAADLELKLFAESDPRISTQLLSEW